MRYAEGSLEAAAGLQLDLGGGALGRLVVRACADEPSAAVERGRS